MLQKMHERMQGIVTIIIIMAICLAFALWGIQYYLHGNSSNDAVAKVNGTKITKSQFQNILDRTRRELVAKFGSKILTDQKVQDKLKKDLLQQLINNAAFFQGADKLGLTVNPQHLNIALASIPAFQVNGHFSQYRFQEVLSSNMYSGSEFIQHLQENIISNQLHYGIIKSAFILPNEVTDIAQLINQKRDINYAVIPKSRFGNTKISTQEIQNYYNQNKNKFTLPEKIRISYLELNAAKLKSGSPVSNAQLQQYYNANIELYTDPAKWQVQHISVALPEGANALQQKQAKTELNKLLKKKAFSKPSWVAANRVPKEMVTRLQQLKPGQTSDPFRTKFGFYVIKVLAAKKERTPAFEQVKTKVAKAFKQQKLAKLFAEQKDKLEDLTYTTSDSLGPAAKALGLKVQATDYFTKDTKSGLLSNPKIINAAFSDSVLNQNYNSDLIRVAPDRIIVLRIKDHVEAKTKPLSAVKNIIRKEIISEKSTILAEQLGQKIIASAKTNTKVTQMMRNNKLTWKKISKLQRTTKLNPEIIATAFALPAPKKTTSISGVKLANGDYALVAVNKIIPGNLVAKNKLAKFKNALALSFGNLEFNLYFAKLVNQAKVKTFT